MMNATTGRAIAWREHISQSIANILTTPIGSRVMRRGYGSYLPDLVDQPLTPANTLRLIAASAQAIMRHEPRTRVTRITLQAAASGSATLIIERTDQGQASATRQSVTIGNGTGGTA